MSESIRVWAAVHNGLPLSHLLGALHKTVEDKLDESIPTWRKQGITIRRATLIVDPPKPRIRSLKGAA